MKKKKIAIYLLFFLVAFFIYFFCGGMDNKFNRLKERNTSADDQIIEESMEKAAISTTDDKRIEKTEKDCADDVMEKNINPYFFPDGMTVIEYDIDFDFETNAAKLYVNKENTFDNGTLYNLVIRYDVGQSDSSRTEDKKEIDLGYFYVQTDKIYLIQGMEISADFTESDLIEKGNVVCQSGTQKENYISGRTFGWHEMIKESKDICAFYRYNDSKESEDYERYEYFMWQKDGGLISYRSGCGEKEKICLRQKEGGQIDFMEETTINPYFFPEGVATVKYDGYFHFKDYDIEKQVMVREVTAEEAVELSICEEKVLEKGVLYSAEIKDNGEIYLGSGEWGEKNREYFVIGLFYVQEDKIYLIRDIEIENDITEEELIKKGTLVCQFESKTYPEGWEFPRRYWNEYINVIGDRCEFYSYETWAGRTSFVESFQWQKGIGLVKYYRGTSFDDDDIMIFLN